MMEGYCWRRKTTVLRRDEECVMITKCEDDGEE